MPGDVVHRVALDRYGVAYFHQVYDGDHPELAKLEQIPLCCFEKALMLLVFKRRNPRSVILLYLRAQVCAMVKHMPRSLREYPVCVSKHVDSFKHPVVFERFQISPGATFGKITRAIKRPALSIGGEQHRAHIAWKAAQRPSHAPQRQLLDYHPFA